MWKLYSKSGDAVCIRTDFGSLSNAMPKEYFYSGVVHYIDFSTAVLKNSNFLTPFFCKRLSFSHEREVRVVYTDFQFFIRLDPAQPPYRHVPISIQDIVKAVFVSPEAPTWLKEVVQRLCEKYGVSVVVEQSALNATALY